MQRSVRFQQIFPSMRNGECQIPSPVPLFSPSQAGHGEQKVLHSIFSPMQSAESKRQANKENCPPPFLLAPNVAAGNLADGNKSVISHCSTEAFYSPAQTVHSSITGISPLSIISRDSARSYRHNQKQASTVALSKLNLDYISACYSVSELHRIVTALTADNEYPSLLRAAKERLAEVRQGLRIEEFAVKAPHRQTRISPRANESHFSQSTLIMSLSSDEDESFDVVVPPPVNSDTIFRVNRDEELLRQIQQLTMKIVEMEGNNLTEQEQYHAKLKVLQSAKEQADSKIRALEDALSKSTGTTNELLQSLETLRRQNEDLKRKLDEQRNEREEKLRQAQEVQNRLSTEIRELSQRLSEADRYRQKEKEMSLLVSAQRNLEKIKNERNQLIRCLLDATGQSNTNVNQMTEENRRNLAAELNKKIQSSRTALNAMATALSRSEDNRKQAIKAQKLAEQEYWKLSDSNDSLQQQNRSLSERIQALTQEVANSRAHAEYLIKSAEERQQMEWQETEKKYKQIIRGLKEQLREQAATVPMELYRNAVDDKKEMETKYKEKQAEIEELTVKVTKLEQQLGATSLPPLPTHLNSPKRNSTSKTRLKVQVLQPASNSTGDNGKGPSFSAAMSETLPTPTHRSSAETMGRSYFGAVPARLPPPPPPTPPPTFSSTKSAIQTKPSRPPVAFSFTPIADSDSGERPRVRISMVRAAGGRKVLQEQLQRRLSPKAMQ